MSRRPWNPAAGIQVKNSTVRVVVGLSLDHQFAPVIKADFAERIGFGCEAASHQVRGLGPPGYWRESKWIEMKVSV